MITVDRCPKMGIAIVVIPFQFSDIRVFCSSFYGYICDTLNVRWMVEDGKKNPRILQEFLFNDKSCFCMFFCTSCKFHLTKERARERAIYAPKKKLNISFYGHSHNVDGDEQEIKKEILADENDWHESQHFVWCSNAQQRYMKKKNLIHSKSAIGVWEKWMKSS